MRGYGKWKEYAGGYTDWLRQWPAAVEEKPAAKAPVREKARAEEIEGELMGKLERR